MRRKLDSLKRTFSLKQVFTIVMATILLTTISSYVVFSQTSMSFPTIIDEGSMVTESSYIIFKDGSTYYARNGKTGEITSSTDASTLINDILANKLTAGRTWKEKVILLGDLEIATTITIPSYTCLEIQGRVKLADSVNVNLIENEDQTNGNTQIEIYGGEIDGNRASNTAGHGIYFANVSESSIHHLTIANVANRGVFLEDSARNKIFELTIKNTQQGIYLIDSNRNFVVKNHIIGNGDSTTYWGVKSESTSAVYGNHISYNIIEDQYYDGIQVTFLGSGNHSGYTISHNTVKGVTDSEGDAIALSYVYGSVIEANIIEATIARYAFILSPGGDNNRIMHNEFQDGIVNIEGTGNVVKFNRGYVTENTIFFSSVSNGTYISHGLAGTPQMVVVTLTVKGYGWIGNKNSTHVQLYFNVATASGSMYVEYEP